MNAVSQPSNFAAMQLSPHISRAARRAFLNGIVTAIPSLLASIWSLAAESWLTASVAGVCAVAGMLEILASRKFRRDGDTISMARCGYYQIAVTLAASVYFAAKLTQLLQSTVVPGVDDATVQMIVGEMPEIVPLLRATYGGILFVTATTVLSWQAYVVTRYFRDARLLIGESNSRFLTVGMTLHEANRIQQLSSDAGLTIDQFVHEALYDRCVKATREPPLLDAYQAEIESAR
jgi:hypothetical protein